MIPSNNAVWFIVCPREPSFPELTKSPSNLGKARLDRLDPKRKNMPKRYSPLKGRI